VLTDRKEDTMILKILHKPTNRDINAKTEHIFEASSFIISKCTVDDLNQCSCNLSNHKEMDWIVCTNDGSYIFDEAYLMNNDGKTIQKYG